MHIDVNSAFLSWSALKLLKEGSKIDLRKEISVVSGREETRHGIVVAASIPAKKIGIKSPMNLRDAKKIYKDVIVTHQDREFYKECSKNMMRLIKYLFPKYEQYSIDECFVDYTEMKKLYGDEVKFAHKLKNEIHKRFGFTVNVGIGNNKLLAKMAKYIITQCGGANGELGATLRYLNQRYTMPDDKGKALLTDIGTEELAHVEMISTMIYQLTKDATPKELEEAGLGCLYAQFGYDLFPSDSFGNPFNTSYIKVSGDYIANLESDMAAELRAKATYEHLMDLTDDPNLLAPLSFLRQREIVHYQRFKELRDYYKNKNS